MLFCFSVQALLQVEAPVSHGSLASEIYIIVCMVGLGWVGVHISSSSSWLTWFFFFTHCIQLYTKLSRLHAWPHSPPWTLRGLDLILRMRIQDGEHLLLSCKTGELGRASTEVWISRRWTWVWPQGQSQDHDQAPEGKNNFQLKFILSKHGEGKYILSHPLGGRKRRAVSKSR